MEELAISCRGITKSYGKGEMKTQALKGINLDIKSKALTLLVGPSGSGKTTLLSIISTILAPDTGELFLMGHDVGKMKETEKAKFRREKLGMVFQSLFLVPTLSVVENVSLPLTIEGESEKKSYSRALDLLETMGLENRANAPPSQLSKGQQQKVAIARAMVNKAQLLICDEPTSALDEVSGSETMQLLQELTLQSSITVLVVTHDQRTFKFADYIVHMNDGKILA